MVSLECLQQPGASKLFSFGLESKRFRPSGPGGLCHSPQPCTAAQKQPEITCLHRGTAVRQENSVYTTGGGLVLFLSRQWVFCSACLYGWTQIKHSPPLTVQNEQTSSSQEYGQLSLKRAQQAQEKRARQLPLPLVALVTSRGSTGLIPKTRLSDFQSRDPSHVQERLLMWVKSTSTYRIRNWHKFFKYLITHL